MPDVKWIKLLTSLPDDEKIKTIELMPERYAIFYVWIMLLIQAGKCNDGGYIYLADKMPYQEEQLANQFNMQPNILKLALLVFQNLKMIEMGDDGLIFIPNFAKHQNIKGLEQIRELNTARARKYRARLLLAGGYDYYKDWSKILARDEGKCVYCGTTENLCADHLVPLAKGGDNNVDNLVTSCKPCNSGKSGRLLEECGLNIINEKTKEQYESVKVRLNITVTHNALNNHATEEDKDIDKERDKNRANAFEVYQNNIGNLTPIISDQIKDAIDSYTKQWVIDAITEATKREKRHWAYIEAVLKNWQREGRGSKKPTSDMRSKYHRVN